ncbi:hypothetical protein ACKFKF_34135 [Phormidesmis sp. 146-12]
MKHPTEQQRSQGAIQSGLALRSYGLNSHEMRKRQLYAVSTESRGTSAEARFRSILSNLEAR